MRDIFINHLLIKKYDQQVPRYTSYPTIPNWEDNVDLDRWKSEFKEAYDKKNRETGISIYIHLPFCEKLCTYCGCNKKITTNHSVEQEYIDVLKKEWEIYLSLMNEPPMIRELHLGGGTPTFFSPGNLEQILYWIYKDAIVHPDHEFSFEGHPNNTTQEHLQTLFDLGFRRVSFGVQDNDLVVQKAINRVQPIENVRYVTETARSIGYTSVNFDLIYGLPFQTVASIARTFEQVIQLRPDRIAFYSYAHVPWTSRAQRLFDESDLPDADTKISLYLKGKELLLMNGYTDIGMDHFALPSDNLFHAWQAGTLHRNFMGYTTQHSEFLLGLGVSAITDTGNSFGQNEKVLHDYYTDINAGRLAVRKGHILTGEDKSFRNYILDISCKGETQFREKDLLILEEYVFPKLASLEKDGLVVKNEEGTKLTTQGHYFIRNVCSAFDLYLNKEMSGKQIFSRAI